MTDRLIKRINNRQAIRATLDYVVFILILLAFGIVAGVSW